MTATLEQVDFVLAMIARHPDDLGLALTAADVDAVLARGAIASGVASGGMIPKLETAIAAVEAGVEAVVILDGRRPHALLVELFTEHGAGTLVRG